MARDLPDFPWTGLYYRELLAALLERKARDLPEHTETGDADPINRILSMWALLGHRESAALDHVALELLWATARLRSSFLPWARLVGYPIAGPTPAAVEVLADLSGRIAGTTIVWAAASRASTRSAPGTAPIVYELEDGPITVGPTGSWLFREDAGGTLTTPTWPLTPLGGNPAVGDAIYIGHAEAMFATIGWDVPTAGPERVRLAWEYRDDRRESLPDAVVDLGSTIRLRVEELLTGGQTSINVAGALVTVRCLLTGAEETIACVASGAELRITTTTTLGQSAISTNRGDYRVTCEWIPLPGLVDGTVVTGEFGSFSWLATGKTITWSHPDGTNRRWAKATVDGVEAFWIRARVVTVEGTLPTTVSLAEPSEVAATVWTVRGSFRQGETVVETLGSSATADQVFTLAREPVMGLTSVTCAGEAWTVVDSFLSAGPVDRVVRYREEFDGTHTITFGDGVRGALPQLPGNIVATYLVGGAEDGNVGAGEVAVDRSSNGRIKHFRNPIAAGGWAPAEGSTSQDLELLRERLPAFMVAQERATSPDDYEALGVAFRDGTGPQIVLRAIAIEEGQGPKTVEVVIVGRGGAAPTSDELELIDRYYNGTAVGLERQGGIVPGNTRAVPTAYTPRPIDVVATLTVIRGYGAGAAGAAAATLQAALQPTARRLAPDGLGRLVEGTSFVWRLGGTVELSVLAARLALGVPGFVDVAWTTPATSSVALGARELPTPGSITLTIVEVSG